MRVIWAMLRANWLAAVSYRLNTIFSFVSLIVGIVPLFFVSRALQPIAANSIRYEGDDYFAFLLVGLITVGFIQQGVNSLPSAMSGAVSSGTLDTLLSVPTSPLTIFAGLTAYGYVWTAVRSLLTLVVGVLLGAHVVWARVPAAVAILALIVLAYLPFGMISAAMVVAFRTAGPIGAGVLLVSNLLGGVYYSTTAIPSWIQALSGFVPLTYGLRALRRVVLEGLPVTAVAGDLGVLLLFTAVFSAIGAVLMVWAFRYARRAGTLSQYLPAP